MCICPCIVRPCSLEKTRNAHKKRTAFSAILPARSMLCQRPIRSCVLAYIGPRLLFSLSLAPLFPLSLRPAAISPVPLLLSPVSPAFASLVSMVCLSLLPFSSTGLFTSFSRNPYPCRSPLPGPSPCVYTRYSRSSFSFSSQILRPPCITA